MTHMQNGVQADSGDRYSMAELCRPIQILWPEKIISFAVNVVTWWPIFIMFLAAGNK